MSGDPFYPQAQVDKRPATRCERGTGDLFHTHQTFIAELTPGINPCSGLRGLRG